MKTVSKTVIYLKEVYLECPGQQQLGGSKRVNQLSVGCPWGEDLSLHEAVKSKSRG